MILIENFKFNTRLELKSLKIREGKINIIIGPNGAGKSSLLEVLSKNEVDYTGEIIIDGVSLHEITLQEYAQFFSYTPQKIDWNNNLLVGDIILFGLYPFSESITLSATDNDRLSSLVTAFLLRDLLNRPFGELSGGEQKRVAIAAALFQNTKIVVIDEPFAALDPFFKGRIAKALKKWQQDNKITMIFSIHDLHIANTIGDYFFGLKSGHLLYEAEKLDQRQLESLFEIPFSLLEIGEDEIFLPLLGECYE